MGPKGHVRYLDSVMGDLPGAQWVRNHHLIGFFLSLKFPFLRGVQGHVLGLQCHQSGCDFWLESFGWINET